MIPVWSVRRQTARLSRTAVADGACYAMWDPDVRS